MGKLRSSLIIALLLLVTLQTDAQTMWFKYEGNPVLTPGPAGSWDQVCVAPSRVIFEDSLYRMWYSATNNASYAGWRVGHATSRDGAHWVKMPTTFVLDAGPGAWESASASWPDVVRTPSGYKMWYSGTDGPSMLANLRLGYAASPDGLVWTKFGRSILGTGSWYAQGAQGISVLGPDSAGNYKMWFQGNPLVHAAFQIGYATATDETTWTVREDPVFSWGVPGSWDDDKVMTPCVLFDGEKYEMFYSGERALNVDPRTQIGYATSPDGIIWTRSSANPVLQRGPSSWDMADIISNPVVLKDNIYHMWYGANATSGWSWTTCYAVSPKGLVFTVLPRRDTLDRTKDTALVRVQVPDFHGHSYAAIIRSGGRVPLLDTLQLFDDGLHGDSLAQDGVFANRWMPGNLSQYTFGLKLTLYDTLTFLGMSSTATRTIVAVGDNPEASLPLVYQLEQNYPNPFNPTTTIRYQLPVASRVELTVYNLLGQKVAELVNGEMDAAYHEVAFTANYLAGGVYFYRLQAGSFIQSRKMLLVR